MTHQNHQTNGASLEDCHTNFFALTDLCGIKWRKFVNGERVNASSDPLDDPILRSYSRCMQADILCVWRRIQSTRQENSDPNALFEISSSKVHPPLSLAAAKELWIFWYGEEPDLTELVDAELLKVAANQALWNGTWERGLTYECRSLLFKALHNLMERFVLTKDIVRFGKWFVQPCTSNDRLFGRSSQHLSFSFTFFVHGDTVCASIDLREHPAVRPLTKEHLKEAAAALAAATNSQSHEQHGNTTNLSEDVASPHNPNNGGISSNSANAPPLPKPRKVILAPFGMAATLTGNSFKATDPMAEKILEDWASFFPLCNKENSDVPPVVEVVSGGHKMYHPSIYVLVTDLDDMEEMEAAALQKDSLGTTSSAEAAALAAISSVNSNELTGDSRKLPTNHSSSVQQLQQQQQQQHAITAVTTTVVTSSVQSGGGGAGSGSSVVFNGSGVGGNSSIAMVEQRLHELQVRTQPHYDTKASSFTANTTNTHASPQAATEMPERVWQDCITNTLHVAYAASVATNSIMGTGVSTGAATPGGSTSSTTLPTNTTTTSAGASGTTSAPNTCGGGGIEDCNSNSGNNNGGNGDNNSGNGCTAMDTHNANTNTTNDVKDIKDINGMETKLRMQQLQFWGFVDPIEKAPCTCTKIPSLSLLPFLTNTFTSKYTASTSTTTTLSMTSPISSAPGPVSSLRLCNNSSMMMTLGCKAHTGTTGCSNTNHSHHNQQQQYQQQYQQPHQHQYNINIPLTLLSPSSAPLTSLASSSSSTSSSSVSCGIARGVSSSSRTSMHIPFHRRQQFDFDSDSHTTGGRQNFTTNTSNSISKCQSANSSGSGGSGGVCYDIVILDNGGGGTVDTVDSASPAATSNNITTMLHYKTLDTIPKQRNLNLASMTPHDTPHGGASTYSRNSVGDLMPVPSVGSPGTPAQSPHPNSTLSQPTSVPPAEQLLTTSPRAPPSVPNLQQPSTPIDHLLDKNTPAPTPTDQHDNKSITTSPYVRPTPSVEPPPSVEGGNGGGGMSNLGSNGPGSVQQPPSVGRCTPTITSQQQPQQQPAQSQAQMAGTPGPQCGTITIKKFDLQQPPLTPLNADQIKTEPGYVAATSLVGTCNRNGMPIVSVASGISAAEAISDYWKSFKTPDIKVKDIDSFANDDCSKFDVLYDFTYQNAWANHPMERFKPNEASKPYRSMCTKNLYEGHTHSKPLMPSPGSLYGSQILSIDASLNPLCDPSINGGAAMGGNTSGGLVGIAAHGGGSLTNLNDANTVGSDRNSNTSGYFHNIDIKTTDTMQGQTSPCKEGKSNASGNLYTAEGLNPSMNDLEQLFETSNDDCGSVQIHTPPDSNNPSSETTTTTTIDDLKRNSSSVTAGAVAIAALQNCNNTSNSINNPLLNNTNNSNNGSGGGGGPSMIQAEDLTKMFPTPPSHEQHHPNSSPCQMDIQMTDLSVITASASATMSACLETSSLGGGIIKIKQEYSVELGSPVEDPIEDWSYVYRPPKRAKFVGSSKYAPLTNLPSQTLPPLVLPHNYKYKPSWTTQKSRAVVAAQAAAVQQQQQLQQQQLHQQHQQLHELLSAPRTPLQQPRTPLGPIPSPMHSSTVPTPLNSGGGGGGAGAGSNNLLLNQLNCPQAALTNTPGGASMQHLMQRAGMSPISPNPASVVPFPMMQQPQRHPPPPYEMAVASPATSTSSYLNKQYHSQEHPPTPQSVGMPSTHLPRPLSAAGNLMTASGGVTTGSAVARELPEVSSLIVNILLYDTALNVFRDHNFDSSTVCVCNADAQKVDIRGADSGVYVPLPGGSFNPLPSTANINGITGIGGVSSSGGGGVNMRLLSAFGGGGGGGGGIGSALDSPASLPGATGHTGSGSSSASATPANNNQHITGYVDDDPIDCMCGFSAVVNRRLAFRAGLFYEDEMEITGVAEDPGRNKKQSIPALIANLATALTPHASAVSPLLPNKGRNSLVPAHKIEKSGSNNVQPDAQALQCAHMIFDLLLEQCSIIQTSSSSIHRALQRHRHRLARQSRQPQSVAAIANVLEFVDANDVMCLALEQARLAFESNRMDINEFAVQHQLSPFHPAGAAGSGVARRNHHQMFSSRLTVHKWPYIPVGFSRSNKEIVRTMNFIQPMLQNAFHSKSRSAAGSKDATYTVSGPLTWRQFHRLAGRASGQCEPQPIPSVIVGHDKDWVSVAPLAIHYWDKFLLEPYAYPRDIVYLVVCPENDFVVDNTRKYFRELSSTYEMCKLGHHTPIRGWDGLLTVGPRTPTDNTTSTNTPLDDWLSTLDDSALAEKIRLYASAFHNQIAPYLNRVPGDKTLLNPPENSSFQPGAGRERGTTSPMGSSTSATHGGVAGADADKMHNSPQKMEGVEQQQQQQQQQQQHQQQQQQQQSTTESADIKPDIKADNKPPIVLSDPLGMADTMEDINAPAIVLYIVEPFTFGSDSPELERLACIALLRCYAELLKSIPDSVRANMNIQIISLESIVELGRSRSRKRFSDEVRCLALNIFSQCRRHLLHTQAVKSLTGFGTAANMEAFLKSKDDKNRQPYKMYTPPYVLAPMHEKNDKSDFSRQSASMRALNEQKYSVMYCNYCLSEDQSWLLATVTDDRGEMFEKIIINIDVPNRTRRRKAPARRVGLKKLMDFIMGLISQTTHPWRLVVGRIGRIGHSELKSWSSLLSKQNLQKASKQLKDCCKQCSLMYPPGILSACLVTLEPDSKLRVMPDQFTPDERFSQISMQNPLSTPQDVTCTHILVFPTSAVCLSFTRQFQNEPQVDLENDFLNFDEEDENEGFTDADLGDLLLWDPQPGRMSNHCSPEPDENRSWQSASGNNFNSAQQQDVEEVGSINQQPLAVGYMVSTAPTGRMPSWFWSACPHLEDVCPVFLKTALHLHVPNIQTTDDILNSTNAHSSATDHPLDSSLTADVLRFVLEGYNALSWLALDSNTHDRLSCLPINVQMLMDLYYLAAAIM